MIVDVWGQLPTQEFARAPWLETLRRWTGRSEADFAASLQDTLSAMDEANVGLMLLSAWYGPEGCLISNEAVAADVDAAPDRFRGLASVDLRDPMHAVRELRRWVDRKLFVGVRVVPWLWDLPLNDRRYYPIYATCVELNVPFCTQIGHTGPLRRSEVGRLIPCLEDVLLDFPELTVVGGHVGFPWIDELISMTAKFPNLFVDTSAYALHRLPPAFIDYMKGLGASRVMFGSNWPMLAPRKCLEGLENLKLSSHARDAFLFGNARRAFRL
jgi:uncharacterized protein